MLLQLLEYNWAEHIDEALMLLSRTDVKTVPLAGGTYLLGLTDESIQAVVDLRDLQLDYIRADAQGTHIGAMTTLQSMVESPELQHSVGGLLARAALASSFSRLIRNSATLGGTLGAGIASQADLLTALAVTDAVVLLRSGSKTQVNLSGGTAEHPGLALAGVTYKGKAERRVDFSSFAAAQRANELIIEVEVPPFPAGSGTAFLRVGRTPSDIALLNAACLVQVRDGAYQRVRLALGGVNMAPVRLESLEKQIEGRPAFDFSAAPQWFAAVLQEGLASFRPPSDFRAGGAYRRSAGKNLAFRAIEEASNVARWQSRISSEGSM
jgi:CO/xanthine dehydrogenase FAD-binding subunit